MNIVKIPSGYPLLAVETGLYHQVERLRTDPGSVFYPGNNRSRLADYFLNLGASSRFLAPQQTLGLQIDFHGKIHHSISPGIEEVIPLQLLVGLACVELKFAADHSLDTLLEHPITVIVGEQDHDDHYPDGRMNVFSQEGNAYYNGSDNLMHDPAAIVPRLVDIIKKAAQGSTYLAQGTDLLRVYTGAQLTRNPESGIIVHTFGERLDLGAAYEKVPLFKGYLTLEQQVGEDGKQIPILISDPQDQANVRAALEYEKERLISKRGAYRLAFEERSSRKPYAFVDGAFYNCGAGATPTALNGRQAFIHCFGQKIDTNQFKKV